MADLNGLSHSSVETYQQCGEKYRLRKVVRVEEIPGWSMIGGNAVHTATAALDLKDFGVPTEDPDNFREAFEAEEAKIKATTTVPVDDWSRAGRVSKDRPNKEDKAWWLENGQTFVDNWRNFLQRSPLQIAIVNDAPAVEIPVELQGDQGFGRVNFRGYIDRILETTDGLRGVVDLKTGSRTPATHKQLAEYRLSLGLVLGWEHAPSWGSYFMNRTGELTLPVSLADEFPLERIDHEYAEAARGIAADVFPARPGPLCSSCSVRRQCFEFRGELSASLAPWVLP